ncbi:molybdenum cofactor guanylyltransferase [Thermanaeromonas toyohensis ToBE]|uniref:Probable molybdenum cofactor guanylyltransferase n=1 Tax=Thermanaeromonas toyohensis ToBE TaxID=698762 RepID=A0A1W1W0I9_9FIRM|nr:molybdenum cofactor guanylyltransferase [Thermanaeromonas toyohensis]SMB99096.1 molybdenum cofactor guanylyltransferase [Thermanaeromonas toyohensis ToBE]
MEAAGIVLAGGRSTRMGTNKALLSLGQETMIGRVVGLLKLLFPEIILVTNEPELYQDLQVKLVQDIFPAQGPLSGIHAGLLVSPYWYNFVVACDMPFLNLELITFMVKEAQGFDGAVPRLRGSYQPLHAVYSRSCLLPIESCLKRKLTQVIAFYPAVRLRLLEAEVLRRFGDLDTIFFNINTPADLDIARRKIKNQREGGAKV